MFLTADAQNVSVAYCMFGGSIYTTGLELIQNFELNIL